MRRALITGGGSGIGLAIAQRLAETCEVTVLGRDKAKLEATGFAHIVADVADPRRGVLPSGSASVEAPNGSLVADLLLDETVQATPSTRRRARLHWKKSSHG